MARMRFTKTERELFTVGAEVEWRNGAHWHPGVISGDIYQPDRFEYVPITHKGRSTATVSTGQRVTGRPTTVRLLVKPVCEWFALCDNVATTTVPHPVLGEVPICDRCKAKNERLRA